jgi:hypothetical protein
MKYRPCVTTACVLIAAGSAAAEPAAVTPTYPVMVLHTSPTTGEKLRRATETCVELTKAGKFERALSYCSVAVEQAESDDGAASTALDRAAARSNRAVVRWLMRAKGRAAEDLAVAERQAPGTSFVRTNIAVMGIQPPVTLAGGAND